LARDWNLWAREDQLEPGLGEDSASLPWRTWLILGGRGAGKTRAGAEWIRSLVRRQAARQRGEALRIALVGETMRDARSVMVEGVSGLLAVHGDDERPVFETGRQQLVWPGGAIAQVFSAEDPDGLRGPQFHVAWCDELAKWRYAEETWDMLQFALRLGALPRQLVTTTPRPIPLLKRLMADPGTVTARVRTAANADNLSPAFIAEMTRRYAGSVLGRQELDGEIVEEYAGALWRLDWIERMRVERAPPLIRIVVAVDPPVTATAASDACGIVIAGIGEDRRGYVLADRTIQGRESAAWARAAVAAYRDFEADRIVAEVNQGGDLVTAVIRQIDKDVPLSQVRATRGKFIRAEPVAALYAEGRIAHVGYFRELEQQMLAFGAGGLIGGRSPDRLDALVWALTELMIEAQPLPSIRAL
jgi:phage terminase large subunit-like protein